ncbi:MAG: hypothetical protein WCJ25_02250 [Candidatus Moraniibacteriota bacterium]
MNETDKPTGQSERAIVTLRRRASGDAVTVFAVIAFFVIASGVLFSQIDRGLDPNYGKNWWTLSFETRDPASDAFIVENHSSATRFTYTVSRDGTALKTGTVTLEKGKDATVSPEVPVDAGRTSVSVTANDGTKKEIYRER